MKKVFIVIIAIFAVIAFMPDGNKEENSANVETVKEEHPDTIIASDTDYSNNTFRKKLKKIYDSQDIVKLYNARLTEEQRQELIVFVENKLQKDLKEMIGDRDSIYANLAKKIVESLSFLDEIQTEDWADLRKIQNAAKTYNAATKNKKELKDKYKGAEIVENYEDADSWSFYVLSKIRLTDCFLITNYEYEYGVERPAGDFHAAMKFKNAPSREGVMSDIMFIPDGTMVYKTIDGFEEEINKYKEVTKEDIEYTEAINKIEETQAVAESEIINLLGLKK